jgi:hypothetical protein
LYVQKESKTFAMGRGLGRVGFGQCGMDRCPGPCRQETEPFNLPEDESGDNGA